MAVSETRIASRGDPFKITQQYTVEPNLEVRQHFRPEIGAGGFSRHDSMIEFHTRVNALIQPNMDIIDLGAGRGKFAEDHVKYRRRLRDKRDKAGYVIGLDVDPIVHTNTTVHKSYVIESGKQWPIVDGSIGLIVSDWVLEHVADPEALISEAYRVLKPGGWFCARTPNKWGLVGLAARLIPNGLHARFLRTLQKGRAERDVFPVTYKINTKNSLGRLFSADKWADCSYADSGDPSYIAGSHLIWILTAILYRLLPEAFATNLYIFMQKLP